MGGVIRNAPRHTQAHLSTVQPVDLAGARFRLMLYRGRDGPHQWYETARRCRFAHTGQLYPAPADGPIRPGAYQRYAQPRAAGAAREPRQSRAMANRETEPGVQRSPECLISTRPPSTRVTMRPKPPPPKNRPS